MSTWWNEVETTVDPFVWYERLPVDFRLFGKILGIFLVNVLSNRIPAGKITFL